MRTVVIDRSWYTDPSVQCTAVAVSVVGAVTTVVKTRAYTLIAMKQYGRTTIVRLDILLRIALERLAFRRCFEGFTPTTVEDWSLVGIVEVASVEAHRRVDFHR